MSFTGSGVWVRYVRHAVTKSVQLLVFASSNQSGVTLVYLERVWMVFVSLPRSLASQVMVFFSIKLCLHCQFAAIVEEAEVLLKWPEFVMLDVMMLSWCFNSNVPPWSPVSFLALVALFGTGCISWASTASALAPGKWGTQMKTSFKDMTV